MCTHAAGAVSAGAPQASASVSITVPSIHCQQLKKALAGPDADKYALINVVERDEEAAKVLLTPTAVVIPLGELIRRASGDDEFKRKYSEKILVLYCPGGMRSEIAAREIIPFGFKVKALAGGSNAWLNPAASSFDWVGVYGGNIKTKEGLDRLSSVLSISIADAKQGDNCAIVLMGDGIYVGVATPELGGLKGDEAIGAPFSSIAQLIQMFIDEGGLFFVCHSCVVNRKLDYPQMKPWIHKGTAPDVARWIKQAKGTLQFI